MFFLKICPNQLKQLCVSSCGGAKLEFLDLNLLNSLLRERWTNVMALLVVI